MNKNLIKKRFSKNLGTYNDNAVIQKKMAKNLLDMLQENKFNNILEIGCGTGLLTEYSIEKLDFESYTAIDIVKSCESYINQISPDINFVECDMEDFLTKNDNKYDLILSNASLQWVENLQDYIKKLISILNPNGEILFSTFGKENYREISLALNKSLKYYSVDGLKQLFAEYQPQIEEEIHVMAFKSPKDVIKHISLTGVNALEETFWTKKDLKAFENMYNNICSNSPTLTYNPIYVKIG